MTSGKGFQAFPRTEYLRRLSSVRAEMRRREIDVLFVTSPSNITYLTGHTAFTAYVPQGLVVTLDAEEPKFFLRQMDAPAATRQTFLDPNNVIGYSEDLVGNPDRDGYDRIIEYFHETGLGNATLGLEPAFLTLKQFGSAQDKFKEKLPKAKIVDFSKAIDRIRMVKSDLELALMREAATISDAAMARAAEVIRPGVREADAAAEIVATLIRGANGKPGTALAPICFCASPYTGTAHVRWGEDEFREGSQLNLELGGVRWGYAVGLMRTFIIGRPSDRLRRMHEAEVAGLENALNVVRPGVTCSDIASAFNRTMAKHGLKKESRCGYAIGIDWTEPTASLREGDMTELKPNMTFHMMLGNWVDENFGYVISETFRVTDSGVEVLTKTPRKLFEL